MGMSGIIKEGEEHALNKVFSSSVEISSNVFITKSPFYICIIFVRNRDLHELASVLKFLTLIVQTSLCLVTMWEMRLAEVLTSEKLYLQKFPKHLKRRIGSLSIRN